MVAAASLFTIKLLNVVVDAPLMALAPEPLKDAVCVVPEVKVPLFVQFPETQKSSPFALKVALVLIETFPMKVVTPFRNKVGEFVVETTTLGVILKLVISNVEAAGVEAFPNWRVPPVIFTVPALISIH